MSKDAEQLRKMVRYDPKTGVFTRLVSISNRTKVGDVAGYLGYYGYLEFRVLGKLRLAHRLAWLYMTGEWPQGQIDHRDGIRTNNKFSNLRDVSVLTNQQNRRLPNKNNTSGYLGVSPKRDKWQAQIRDGAKSSKSLGVFSTPQEAHAAYLEAKHEIHEGCTI